MFKRSKLSQALMLAFSGVATISASPATAQQAEQPQTLERVEITGSSVKRIQQEGALPVQILRRSDIERSGATNVADLLQSLPAAQGSIGQAAAVGAETFGFVGISLRNLTEQRTLVLLNGKRITMFGGQTITGSGAAVDLNAIPITAIERIEILTDGASALYGTDAIAGVVNFITRKDATDGDVTIGISNPKGGGIERRISASKGFGKLEENGFNFLIAGSADKRTPLGAIKRDYAKSALVQFNDNGRRYQINSGSPSNIPANVVIGDEIVSPYFIANGECPPNSFQFGARACYFDYVTQLQIVPEQKRKNLYLQGSLKLPADATLTAEFLYANSKQTTRIAPVPGSIPIDAADLPAPINGPNGQPVTGPLSARYRVFDLGPRTSINESDLYHFTVGVDGRLGKWDYNTSFVHSESKAKTSTRGYPDQDAFFAVLDSGLIDPFVGPGQQSPAGIAALQGTLRDGYYNGGKATLDTVAVRATTELSELPGGPLSLGTGVNFSIEKNNNAPSLLAQGISGTRFGDEGQTVPYSAKRKSAGIFAELVAPVRKELELTAGVRYDKYQGVGDTTNGKLAARWTPSPGLLVRASLGSGFRAPTVPQLKAPEQVFGVTSDQYDCTAELQAVATALNGQCRPNGDQYDVYAGGTAGLKAESSRQASLGFRVEPTSTLSLGADIWTVAIKDTFGQIAESQYFADPAKYESLFRIRQAGTGERYLAIFQGNQNLGKSFTTGIDFDVSARQATPVGRLNSQLTATYMLRNDYQLEKGGEYFTSLGRYGEDTLVTFRWQARAATTLEVSQAWSHTLVMNYKAGYHDSVEAAERVGADGQGTGVEDDITRRVASFVSFDWQTNWNINKDFRLQVGVLNLFDREPPFSIVTGGLNKGQMRGYDDRYYDARGRTYYLNASYKF